MKIVVMLLAYCSVNSSIKGFKIAVLCAELQLYIMISHVDTDQLARIGYFSSRGCAEHIIFTFDRMHVILPGKFSCNRVRRVGEGCIDDYVRLKLI